MTTGEKIRNARQKAGYTQEQLAENLSVSRQAIAKWESDRGVPDIENLKAISAFFNLSVDDLLNPDVELGAQTDDNPETAGEQSVTDQEQQADKSKEKSAKNKFANLLHNKRLMLCVAAATVILILLVVVFTVVIPSVDKKSKINQAESLMKNGEYFQAAAIYKTIPTKYVGDKYNECLYLDAKQYYQNGDYEQAIERIKDTYYNDSKDLYNSWRLEYALYNVKQGDYTKAIKLFEELGEYGDSKAKLNELYYHYAVDLYNKKDFNLAKDYFAKTSKDDGTYLTKARYNYACELYNAGEYGKAYNQFNKLVEDGQGDYEDTGNLAVGILKRILLAGVIWTKTEPINQNNVSANLSYAFLENSVSMALNDAANGKNIGTIKWDSTYYTADEASRKLGINETFILASDSNSVYVFTFGFFSNDKVSIHINDHSGKCDAVACGTYMIDTSLNESKGTMFDLLFKEKLNYTFEKISLDAVSFEDEYPADKSQNADGTNQNADGTNQNAQGTDTEAENVNSTQNTTQSNSQTTVNRPTVDTTPTPDTDNSQTQSQVQSQPTQSNQTNKCADGHTWQAITTTVHHDEEGHDEWVVVKQSYTWYKCGICGKEYDSKNSYYAHFDSTHTDSMEKFLRENYTHGTVPTEYEKKWVVDKEAYDQTVITGYKCSECQATK